LLEFVYINLGGLALLARVRRSRSSGSCLVADLRTSW